MFVSISIMFTETNIHWFIFRSGIKLRVPVKKIVIFEIYGILSFWILTLVIVTDGKSRTEKTTFLENSFFSLWKWNGKYKKVTNGIAKAIFSLLEPEIAHTQHDTPFHNKQPWSLFRNPEDQWYWEALWDTEHELISCTSHPWLVHHNFSKKLLHISFFLFIFNTNPHSIFHIIHWQGS